LRGSISVSFIVASGTAKQGRMLAGCVGMLLRSCRRPMCYFDMLTDDLANEMSEGVRVRRATIDSLPALVVDGLMSKTESAQLFNWLRTQPFRRTEFARPDRKAFLHWAWK